MSKYYRRIGTIAYRFVIEAHIKKIELKLPSTGPNSQRVSVILKQGIDLMITIIRWYLGESRRETNNASLMEDGVAFFNEKLIASAIMYYDKRRKAFLPKEVKNLHFLINMNRLLLQ